MSNDLNWHIERPFEGIVNAIVPSSKHKKAIEDCLLDIYVAEHYDYSIYKQKDVKTTYDIPIAQWLAKKECLEADRIKEEDTFTKFFQKLQKQDIPLHQPTETVKDEDTEEDIEDEVKPSKNNGKKQQEKLIKQIQSSMAASQQRLMELNDEIADLDEKITYYEHYQRSARHFLHKMNELVITYEKTKDKKSLILELDSLLSYCDKMKRRYVKEETCAGTQGLCKAHHLPLEGIERPMCCMMPVV